MIMNITLNAICYEAMNQKHMKIYKNEKENVNGLKLIIALGSAHQATIL